MLRAMATTGDTPAPRDLTNRALTPLATGAKAPAAAGHSDDWPARTADAIDRVVGKVRSKTTQPVENLSRVAVYGLVAAIAGLTALVLLVIIFVRLLAIILQGEVWAAYLTLGILLVLAGFFLWRKRTYKTVRV